MNAYLDMDRSSPGTHPEPPSHHQLAPSQLSEGYAPNAVSDYHQTVTHKIYNQSIHNGNKMRATTTYPLPITFKCSLCFSISEEHFVGIFCPPVTFFSQDSAAIYQWSYELHFLPFFNFRPAKWIFIKFGVEIMPL
jgi:hypothetical protein